MCVCICSPRDLFLKTPTPQPPDADPQPSLLLLTTIPSSTLPAEEIWRCLIPFPGCGGHRAGLFWRSGSIITPSLARIGVQALNSSRALCLMGRLGRGSPRLEQGWLGVLRLPLGEVEMILGEGTGGRVFGAGGRKGWWLWSQGVCGCERC